MKNRYFYNYLAEVTTADVTIKFSDPDKFTFNESRSIAEYFNKIIHKEIQMTAQINHILCEPIKSNK